jgi:diguanylate cyclase (GGDEF)-like protein
MRHRHLIVYAACCACTLLSLAPVLAETPETTLVENSQPVRVGVFENPPIVAIQKRNAPEGIAIDVIRYVAAREDWRVEYVAGPWDQLLTLLDAGQIDLLVGIAYNEERAQRYQFSRESLLGNWGMVYARPGAKVNSLLDLKGLPVALMRGGTHSKVFVRLMADFKIAFTPMETDTYQQVLEAIERGDAKAGVVNRTFGALNAHSHNVVETGIVFNPVYIHYAAPKAADPARLQALDRHLAALKADQKSIYYDSLRRWLETQQTERIPAWALWATVATAGLLTLVILIAAWLRHQVRRQTGELRQRAEQLRIEIEQRQQTQERLNDIAYYDGLTRLPNRAGFNKSLAGALQAVHAKGGRLALLFIDIDRLKNINDGLGHAAGDVLLQRVAERMQSSLRDRDQLNRFGGDEFVAIISGIDKPHEPELVAERLLQSLSAAIDIGVTQVYVTASIGIALYPDDARSMEELLKHSDTAMYQAKEQGGNRFLFYNTTQTQRAVERLTADTRLRQAMERGEMRLHYQPVVAMPDRRIVGVEALLRWQDPEQGLVMPASFIPAAEDTGLIIPLGEWVLEESCAQLRAWQKQGITGLHMAVNVSTRQVEGRRLIATVERALEKSGLAPEFLELEITEGVMLVMNEDVRNTLMTLRDMGVRLTIDDFGTGYSSLSYLRQLPFQFLKIDRSFVMNIPANRSDTQIATTILLMAQGLGLQVVAEGVETEQQHQFLKERGCEYGQGYLFSRPQAADSIPALLDALPVGLKKA